MKNNDWVLKDSPDLDQVHQLQDQLDCSELFASLCVQRSITNSQELRAFSDPQEGHIHDPYLFYDMDKAVDRITEALMSGELITIYGDYDADGVTSTSLLLDCIDILGGQANYYIPNRFDEGYGPNPAAFQKMIDNGTGLIITCDNGVQGHEAIQLAQSQGVDVVVTDHHELPDQLPEAYAVIHPRHPKGQYPFDDLAGVGVAFKLAHALLEEFPHDLLDLLAIGTIADLVRMSGENHSLVKMGMKILSESQRPGLRMLMKFSGTDLQEVDETVVGFRLAPRLNAAGRMGSAALAVDLLRASDDATVEVLAEKLERMNQDRKRVTDLVTREALQKIQPHALVNVLTGEDWHEGVLGIVASRIVEKTGKPSLVLTQQEGETDKFKGSGRSLGEFNLYEALLACDEWLEKYGGHHMAAGLTVKQAQLEELQASLDQYLLTHFDPDDLGAKWEPDMSVQLDQFDPQLVNELKLLQPFGPGNEQPLFLLENVLAADLKKIGSEKTHLKGNLEDEKNKMACIAFNQGPALDKLGDRPQLDVLAYLEVNEWNGVRSLQLNVQDLYSGQVQIIDRRSSKLHDLPYQNTQYGFVFFHKHGYHQAKQAHPQLTNLYLMTEEVVVVKEESVVLVDIPEKESQIMNLLTHNDFQQILVVFQTYEDIYMEGLASRDDFAKVFKYLYSHPSIEYGDTEKRSNLAHFLKLPLNLLNHIILVFLEVGYVKMELGILSMNSSFETVDLTETKTYKDRQEQLKLEELLLYSSMNELTDRLLAWTTKE